MFSTVLESIVGWYAPHACAGCGSAGTVLCRPCLAALPRLAPVCYRCNAPADQNRTCTDCKQFGLDAVAAVTPYAKVAKDTVWKLKFGRARMAAMCMALPMARLCRNHPNDTVVVPLPTAPSRVRPRGYDQAVLLAKMTARRSRLAYAPLLIRRGKQRQVGASRAERYEHMQDAFALRRNVKSRVAGKHVILVDDVITTGATAESAAQLLRAAGARSVVAVAFARANIG